MEDNFDQNDFEEFLKDQVRNHKMYPSDSVWRNINTKLHGDKKWPALTFAALVFFGAALTICAYFFPKPNIFAIEPRAVATNTIQPVAKNDAVSSNPTSPNSLFKEKTNHPVLFNNTITESRQTSAVAKNIYPIFSDFQNQDNLPYYQQNDHEKTITVFYSNVDRNTASEKRVNDTITNNTKITNSHALEELSEVVSKKQITNKISKPVTVSDKSNAIKDYNDKNMVDGFLKDNKEDIALYTITKPKSIKNKFSYQFYVAPSVSYRKLLEDPSILRGSNLAGPVGLNHVTDVNKVVRHKPGNGIEAGISLLYNLSEKFRIKTGFQFNLRQYSIEAYRSNTEVSSIALIENNRIDTVNTVAYYRNNNGFYSAELVNRYYQLAVPIGVEWEVIGNRKVQFNIAGTIQPTYLINRNAYLLSTNFKNYSENPEMVRSWNINSNAEAFISFKVGDFKWQIGPQVRYQPYSTFIPQYPIKEHLLDYGFKIGVSKIF